MKYRHLSLSRRRGAAGLLVAALSVAAPAGASIKETYISAPNMTIPAGPPLEIQLSVPNVGEILDVDVSLKITHGNVSDLAVRLIYPDGVTSVLLIDRRCGSGDGFELGLSDEAATSISDQPANCAGLLTGAFRPEEPLAGFDGLNSLGPWTLSIDDVVAGTQGTLLQWSLGLTYELKAGKIQRCNTTDVALLDPGDAVSDAISDEPVAIADLDVLVDVDHPNVADLELALRAPDLSTLPIVAIPGACDGIDLRVDDEAANALPSSCTDGTTVTGTYRPSDPLAYFDGLEAIGTWQLQIHDGVGGDAGVLEDWCLAFDFGIFRDGFDEHGDLRFWSFAEP